MINLQEIADILEDTRRAQIGDREEIGSGSVNGVEEKQDTGEKNSQRTVSISRCSSEPVATDFAEPEENVQWKRLMDTKKLRQVVTIRQGGAEFPEVIQEDCQLHELDC